LIHAPLFNPNKKNINPLYHNNYKTGAMMDERSQIVADQRQEIKDALVPWMDEIASALIPVYPDPDGVDDILHQAIGMQPKCRLLYLLDPEGQQCSSNVTQTGVDPSFREQDLGERPYFKGNLPWRGITLSSVYAARRDHKLTITALYPLNDDGHLRAFLAADFTLDDLDLETSRLSPQASQWKQFRGDRAIRSTLFLQERVTSPLDEHHDDVNATLTSLMVNRGVFHVLLHFSSARAIIWLLDDPYRYQLLSPDELTHPDTVLAYPKHAYAREAVVTAEKIPVILDRFKELRNVDENIYLRSGSLNIMNGLVGLTFSCDGSHYMSAREFIDKDLSFWFGTTGN
jgi:hypothetical protein